MNIHKEKLITLDSVMKQIEKQYGKGSVMKLESNIIMDIEAISTRCLSLDIALGLG
ncbi:recombinase A [Clostridium tertium]|uniref:Recombinase A n=1 Tax=Clostridium tertium TaxID=1559 RepID=A0A6N2YPC7_9CLOT